MEGTFLHEILQRMGYSEKVAYAAMILFGYLAIEKIIKGIKWPTSGVELPPDPWIKNGHTITDHTDGDKTENNRDFFDGFEASHEYNC